MVLVSRIVTALIAAIAGYQLGASTKLTSRLPGYAEIALNFGVLILLGAIVGWFVGGLIGKWLQRAMSHFNASAEDRSGAELVVGMLGLIVGLAVSALLSIPVSQLDPIGTYLLLPMTLIIAYVSAELAAAKHVEILRLFGANVEASGAGARTKLLDTSCLIDGRIADIALSGFVEGELVVPVYVLEELQHIADSSDDVRRARGRRGLEVVTKLRRERRVTTLDENAGADQPVDSRLASLAADRGWALVTNDVALQKVATARDVPVLNVNELANALKPEFVPGEQFALKVVRAGKERGQGVGYLEDGTMVVVDGAAESIGETVEVEVSSMLQSPTGKLVFTRALEAPSR